MSRRKSLINTEYVKVGTICIPPEVALLLKARAEVIGMTPAVREAIVHFFAPPTVMVTQPPIVTVASAAEPILPATPTFSVAIPNPDYDPEDF